jgi:hypothetical protein
MKQFFKGFTSTLHGALVFSQLCMWCVGLPLLLVLGEGPVTSSEWLETVAVCAGFLLVTYITALLELRAAKKKVKAWDQSMSFIHDSFPQLTQARRVAKQAVLPQMYGATTSSEVSKDKESGH